MALKGGWLYVGLWAPAYENRAYPSMGVSLGAIDFYREDCADPKTRRYALVDLPNLLITTRPRMELIQVFIHESLLESPWP